MQRKSVLTKAVKKARSEVRLEYHCEMWHGVYETGRKEQGKLQGNECMQQSCRSLWRQNKKFECNMAKEKVNLRFIKMLSPKSLLFPSVLLEQKKNRTYYDTSITIYKTRAFSRNITEISICSWIISVSLLRLSLTFQLCNWSIYAISYSRKSVHIYCSSRGKCIIFILTMKEKVLKNVWG